MSSYLANFVHLKLSYLIYDPECGHVLVNGYAYLGGFFWVKYFLGQHFFCLGQHFFWGQIFWVKFFWVKFFWVNFFLLTNFCFGKIFVGPILFRIFLNYIKFCRFLQIISNLCEFFSNCVKFSGFWIFLTKLFWKNNFFLNFFFKILFFENICWNFFLGFTLLCQVWLFWPQKWKCRLFWLFWAQK